METLVKPSLKPRKSPVQARSTASVEAILEATLQVLVLLGKRRLTTNSVALRAGVSVGTLYQYFPNKSSLLHAALRRHLDRVDAAVAATCAEQHGMPLRSIGDALVTSFLSAKLERLDAGLALYQIRDDIGGTAIARTMGEKVADTIANMLRGSSEPLASDPAAAGSMLFAVMADTARRILESAEPAATRLSIERELRTMIAAYLQALKAT